MNAIKCIRILSSLRRWPTTCKQIPRFQCLGVLPSYTHALLQVAPDDSFGPVDDLLQEVFVEMGCKDFPVLIATDNVGKDQYTMSDAMFAIRRRRIELGLSEASNLPITIVVQDVWHARERLAKLLAMGHPDYYAAMSELKIVFARQACFWQHPSASDNSCCQG